MSEQVTHSGSCHCGAVRFEVDAGADLVAHDCNCSICRLCGYQHLIVPAADFRLLAGDEVLITYRFNTRTARHRFCGQCGVKAFYTPRSHPDGVSVNVRCLDASGIRSVTLVAFDGANWEQSVHRISDREPIGSTDS